VYSDGRHPDAVRYTLSAGEDVERRDFTINGLLLDPLVLMGEPAEGEGTPFQVSESRPGAPGPFASPLQGSGIVGGGYSQGSAALHPGLFSSGPSGAFSAWTELFGDKMRIRAAVVDHVGGLRDLDAGVIRAIGQPEARFEEDHLRMLRAVRFAARFGFEIEPATKKAIRVLAPRIAEVSRERVRDELTKMLTEGRARRAFELLLSTGLLAEVLPEAARMVGVEQPPQFHPEGDVWTHVLTVLDQLEAGCPMTLGWGALLHDIGKPATFSRGADRIHFNGHADVGVAIAGEICRRFRFSNEETRQIVELVGNHMRFMDAQRMRDATLKRFFRLGRFEEHLALHKMDCVASNGDLSNWEYARRRWQEMPAAEVRPQPLVTGRELIEAGYKPGAGFRPMLEAVEEAQLEGTIRTAGEGLKLVRERFGGPGE
jgi:poly(A) polymerase